MHLQTPDTPNPFGNFGDIVENDRFIGRKKEIQAIHNRVTGSGYGNLAIVGLPRVGKSSLVYKALLSDKAGLAARKHFVVYVKMSRFSGFRHFFDWMMYEAVKEIGQENKHAEICAGLSEVYRLMQGFAHGGAEFLHHIDLFFNMVRRNGLRLTYILDEFDAAPGILGVHDFQILRELSISPESKVCLVTVSRRSIQEIEPQIGGMSNFAGIFVDLGLGMFSEADVKEYWDKMPAYGLSVSPAYTEKVNYLVGRHPYLMDLFNYSYFNQLKEGGGDLAGETDSGLRLNLYSAFDKALDILKQEKLYDSAFQLVLGPVYDVKPKDLLKLEVYQFLKEIPAGEKEALLGGSVGLKTFKGTSFACFSDYFTLYWKLKIYETDFWSLWKDTEIAVRNLIKEYISETFPTEAFPGGWEEGYLAKYAASENRKSGIDKLKKTRDVYQKEFGSLASAHIVDYTYPRDMYNLFMSGDWPWFAKVFKDGEKAGDKNAWSKMFIELSELRNPVAHNNLEFVTPSRIHAAKSHCEKILDKISAWNEIR